MLDKIKSYVSKDEFFIKRIFFSEVSLKHFLRDIYVNFIKYYRIYLQRRIISKKKYIPSIKEYFSKNLDEIDYRTLIPQRHIDFTESDKVFLNENIACSKQIKRKKDQGYNQREVFLCKLKNVKFFPPTGTLTINDKPLVETACTLVRLKTIAKTVDNVFMKHRKMKGVYTSFMGSYNHVYYHFLIENVTRFYAISEIEEPVINIIVPEGLRYWQIEILKIFWDKRFKLVPIKRNEVFELETFYFPSFWHVDCSAYIPKEISDFVRNKMFKYFGLKKNIERKRRIFFSRGKMHRRVILNRKEMLALLEQYGFEEIHPQEFSVKEQAEIMNSAEIMIAMNGSAFANLIFGTNLKMIIIFPPSMVISHYFLMCKSLNFTYRYIIGYDETPRLDCKVDLRELEKIIKELIEN